MRRLIVIAALVAGCATGGAQTKTPRKFGAIYSTAPASGASLLWPETLSLSTGTIYSLALAIGTAHSVSWDLYAASGNAACTVVVEVSNRYDPATSLATDDTLWTTYAPSGWTPPANLTGAVSAYYVEAVPMSGAYERMKFVCSSGSTTLTLKTQIKAG
jgi:hypothetical protein